MKKKLFLMIAVIFTIFSLSSCGDDSGIITKISEEAEYTKIENSITEVYEKVSKGCVGLAVSGDEGSATGSGVIFRYDADKSLYYVVTNAHVVEDMTTCKVFLGGNKYNSANVVGYDSKNDVAVVTFTLDFLNQGLKDSIYINDFFNYEDNDLPAVGQTVLAIGCPLGLENFNILTTGVVSSVNKSQISMDAAINPGNSGGGLFNLAGRLIGINTEKDVWSFASDGYGSSYMITDEDIPIEGRGYAISLSVVKTCIEDILEENGIVERPLLGITVTTVNTVLSPNSLYTAYLPVSDSIVYFIVTGFNEDSKASAAKTAGVKLYDVLLKVNDVEIESSNDISYVLNQMTMNETLKLTVYRLESGNPITKDIVVSFE